MIVLYDNPFSPFARKVRMALQFKDGPYESVDALALEWLLAHAFQEWFWSELASGRAIVPRSA